MKQLVDLQISEKRVLVRLDLDVPLRNGKIEDITRLEEALPSLQHLLKSHSKVIIIGHLGRPNGRFVSSLTTEPLAEPLSKLLGKTVTHFSIAIGTEVTKAVNEMKPDDIFLLENLRFYPGEEGNDPHFAKALSELGQVYVNDAFANCHRYHASIVTLPKLLPAAAGIHLREEVAKLSTITKEPKRPYVVVVGGAKAETKIAAIEELAKKADQVLIGGKLPQELKSGFFSLTGDNIVIAETNPQAADITSDSIEKFKAVIAKTATIVWNGPLGVFEEPAFETGTREIAQAITESGATTVIGGGDTIAAVKKFGFLNKFWWVSSGGGAMLEFLAKGTLPGIEALGN